MRITGCQLAPLDDVASRRWLDFVLGRGIAPFSLGDRAWLLCHCDDGVTWGRREGDEWRLGSTYFPHLCPVPSEDNIQELRAFSPVAEVLIWRVGHGFSGRTVHDAEPGSGEEQPDRPGEEQRVLLGARICERRGGFTRVAEGTGAEQIVPLDLQEGPASSWPRLRVRHYFARDDRTGCVRVVMTRLTDFWGGVSDAPAR